MLHSDQQLARLDDSALRRVHLGVVQHDGDLLPHQPQRGALEGGIEELKAALRQELEMEEIEERLAGGGLEPRTLEEAEELEAKLGETLEEVRAIKRQLGKGST